MAYKKFNGVDRKLDAARRRVGWYFAKIHILHKRRMLGDDVIKALVSEGQVKDILIEKVEPLEQPDRGEDVYKFFKDLYGIKKTGKVEIRWSRPRNYQERTLLNDLSQ